MNTIHISMGLDEVGGMIKEIQEERDSRGSWTQKEISKTSSPSDQEGKRE